MTKINSPPLGCVEQATAVLGSKWTGQIIRELANSPLRFCELERALPDLNPRTLTKRLQDLEAEDIIKHQADGHTYDLTTKGSDLLPVLREMAKWGAKHRDGAAKA